MSAKQQESQGDGGGSHGMLCGIKSEKPTGKEMGWEMHWETSEAFG